MIIRPVRHGDEASVLAIAQAAGIGMTSLPPEERVVAEKVERSVASFNGTLEAPDNPLYFFVMEDTANGDVVGTCAVEAHIGLRRPMYSYKIVTVTQYSDSLDIFARNEMLQVVNDYAGVSEIGSLFLLPEYRRDRLGRFLSRMRFLFIALFRELFDEKIVAEIRGWHDGQGNSPFYDSLARKFFQMEFAQADWICATQGNRFISELMPTYPIYINLLPEEARSVIGQPYSSSEPAKAMLEREGFYYNHYIDLFDGGPTLEAKLDKVRGVRETKQAELVGAADIQGDEAAYRAMIARPALTEFCAALGWVRETEQGVIVDSETVRKLSFHTGEAVAYARA